MSALASLTAVRKRFGKTDALAGLDLAVQPGEIVAVLGPNGAGKSTAIALLLGLLRPTAGEARLFAHQPGAVAARRGAGVMMQDVTLPTELKPRELIQLVSSYYPAPLDVKTTIALAGIEGIANRRYGKLSGGQKRQVQFALAICGRPQLLFLDEPTTNLDSAARANLWTVVRQLAREGASVVLTTHHIDEAEALANRIVVLSGGRAVAEGAVESIRARIARKEIACRTTLPAADLRQWPDIDTVETEDLRTLIGTTKAEAVVRLLLSRDPGLSGLEVHRATLSDAIESITRSTAP